MNGACEGVLVRSLLMPQPCLEVAQQKLPQGTQRQDDLLQTAFLTLPEGGAVTMIPATEMSCLVTMTMSLHDD